MKKNQNGLIKATHQWTNEQTVDLFAKALSSSQFEVLLGKLVVINVHSNLKGVLKTIQKNKIVSNFVIIYL